MLRQDMVLLEDNLLASNHKKINNQNREYIAQIITVFSLRNIGRSLSFNLIWTCYIFYTLYVFFFFCSIYPNASINECLLKEWMATDSQQAKAKMGKQWKQWQTLFSWAPKSLQVVTAAMKLKDSCSLEEKLWPT